MIIIFFNWTWKLTTLYRTWSGFSGIRCNLKPKKLPQVWYSVNFHRIKDGGSSAQKIPVSITWPHILIQKWIVREDYIQVMNSVCVTTSYHQIHNLRSSSLRTWNWWIFVHKKILNSFRYRLSENSTLLQTQVVHRLTLAGWKKYFYLFFFFHHIVREDQMVSVILFFFTLRVNEKDQSSLDLCNCLKKKKKLS